MTKYEGAVLSAFTGRMIGSFSEFHKYAEKIMERPIFTHEFASKQLEAEIKEKSKQDFLKICNDIK